MIIDDQAGLPAVIQDDGPSPDILRAIAAANRQQHPAAVHMLHDDQNLRLLLSVWPLVDVDGQEIGIAPLHGVDELGLRMLRDWIWRRFMFVEGFSISGAIRALTFNGFPGQSTFERARDAALIYPYGVVHPTALLYLANVATRLTSSKG